MGFEDTDIADDGDVGAKLSAVSCSICLEAVSDNGDRSWAMLLCGHQFHLDCIGSAFNMKGAMQCPNCRKIEKGQWLYANGSRAFPEFNMDGWAHDEDLYDFSYSEMSFGVHWCPFNGLTRLPTSFNEGDFSSNGYHDLLGQHAISMEQTSVSSGSNSCPYIAYVSPVNLSSSNVGTNVSDGSNFNSRWTGNEVPSSRSGGGVEQTSVPPINQRPSRPTADLPRSASFMQPPQVGHSFRARAGSAVSSTIISPYPGSTARARDREQALQAYYQQPNTAPSSRTPSMGGSSQRASHRGLAQVGSLAPASHQLSGFQYVQSAENPSSSGFQAWDRRDQTSSFPSNQIEREATWGTTFHHHSAPETGIRFSGYRQRCASERTSSQNRS